MAAHMRIEDKIYGRFVFAAVLIFFITFMTVDAVFVVLAVKTNTGVVTENAYEKGLSYNETIKQAAVQEKQGWMSSIELTDRTVIFSLKDRNKNPVSKVRVWAEFSQPVRPGGEFVVDLQSTKSGVYRGVFPHLSPGQWRVRVFADGEAGQFQTARIFVQK